MKPTAITRKYKNQLMITTEELKEYAKNRTEMNVIEFKNFQKFKNPLFQSDSWQFQENTFMKTSSR